MRRLSVKFGVFGDHGDQESVQLSAESTDANEVLVEIISTDDRRDSYGNKPSAGAYLNPVEALDFAEAIRAAALEALPDSVTVERGD